MTEAEATAQIKMIFVTADAEKRVVTSQELEQVKALEQTIRTGRRTSPDPLPTPDGWQSHGTASRGKRCADLFKVRAADDCGFKSVEDLARAIQMGDGARLAATGQGIGVPADGGFAVPEAFMFGMLDAALETEVVRPRCRVVPMEAETTNVSTFDDSDHSSGQLFGGLEGEWVGEGNTINVKVAKLRRLKLIARKLAFLTSATNELLNDAPQFEGAFTQRMTQTISWNLDRACLITGTGAGQPRSILNDPALVTVSKETGQAADTIVYENLCEMFSRLHPACIGNSVWVANATAIPQLLQLSVPSTIAGTFVPVLNQQDGSFNMLTRPVVFTEKLNPLGDLGDILLVDFSQYAIGIMHNGMRLARSEHYLYSTDETAWRITMRADGQGTWQQAFTPANGDTLSWCVALAARA